MKRKIITDYSVKQAFYLFRSKLKYNFIIILSFTAAFFMVIIMQSYQDGVLDRYTLSPKVARHKDLIQIRISDIDRNELTLLNDTAGLRNILNENGINDSVKISFVMSQLYNTVIYENKMHFISSVFYTEAEDDSTGVVNEIPDGRIIHGSNFERASERGAHRRFGVERR